MPSITPIKLYLTTSCPVTKRALKIGETHAGMNIAGLNLKGQTGIKNRAYYTEGLQACTGGVVLGNKLNMFHENSSIYDDPLSTRDKVFKEVTKKIFKMAEETKENIQAFLFGGWGFGSNLNIKEVEKSHNLFNNIALCIEDILPEKEGIHVPLTTIWGKLDSAKPDAIYAREDGIVLINDIFKNLFKDGKCNMTREEIIKFLQEHYEEVQIPENVHIFAEEHYEPSKDILTNIARKQQMLNAIV
ncbi:hypothetical protein IJ750_06720 [bacterium]|nr:hypothetical protein [bacterium]